MTRCSSLLAALITAGIPMSVLAEEMATLDVASAGSIRPMLDGPFKKAIAESFKLDLHSHAQGADAIARSIVNASLQADVFISITAGPMLTVMHAGKADIAQPIARTELVLMYSPKSRFVRLFEAAARGKANWWEVLQEPGLRFARSNPSGDPGGRSIIFTMMLAAKKYKQADLVQKVLGPTLNPDQIFAGGNTQARLQSGELDASSSYKVASGFANLPFIVLSKDINLSSQDVHTEHPDVSLMVEGKTFYPEPLLFYAAILKGAANPNGAVAFCDWLMRDEAQGLLREYRYDPAADATALHL